VDTQGRADLDPLNPGDSPDSSAESPREILGLRFKEAANGFLDNVDGPSFLSKLTATHEVGPLAELNTFLSKIPRFHDAEDAGVRKGFSIEMRLRATVTDLAWLVSTESARPPIRFSLKGRVMVKSPAGKPTFCKLTEGSFLQMFVRSSANSDPSRFFHYELRYRDQEQRDCVIKAWKVLRNAPGFDVWLDTSTLFFEMFQDSNLTHRGVMRVPIETFLRKQLPSMDITGTEDAARKSWALAAFYKYFAGELGAVYMMDAEKLKDLLVKLVTGIHV